MLAPNESYCVSSLAALREVQTLQTNMSKSQAEVVLGSFVANGWLHKSKYVQIQCLVTHLLIGPSDKADIVFRRAPY